MATTPGNSINETTTGISGFTGTGFTGSPATQHSVQIGGATSSTLANVTNGTTGQVLTAITGSAPTFQAPVVQAATVVLTSAQVKALNATPIQIVAAPGSGKVNVPISATSKMTYGGTTPFVAAVGQQIDIIYTSTSIAVLSAVPDNSAITATTSRYSCATYQPQLINNTAIASVENVALRLKVLSATEITGNVANDNTVSVTIIYYTVTL